VSYSKVKFNASLDV
jgi:hypothetical protein